MKYTSDGLFLIDLIKHRIEESGGVLESVNLDTRDRDSRNALYWAIFYRRFDDVKFLLKHGISQQVAPEMSALDLAKKIEDRATLLLLCEEGEMPLSA